jgi:hypothetical protein
MAESTDPAVISFEATVDGQTYTSVTDGGKATYDSSGDLYSIYLYNDNNPEFELSMEGNITSPTSAPWLIDDGSQNPEFPTLTDIGIYVLTPTVIPEPTSLTLLAFTAAGLMGRRTTRRLRSTF